MTYAASNHGDLPPGGGGGSGISFAAVMRSFKRQIPLMLVIFLILAVTGWYFGGKLKRTYSAEGRMMVTISDDYIFTPLDGNNQSGLTMTPDSITLNEIAIMNNPDLIQKVMEEVGFGRLFPEDAREYASASGLERSNVLNDMVKKFESAFVVYAQPKSSVVVMKFEHEDPQLAVETLNALIEAYKVYRNIVFTEDKSDMLGERRAAKEEQLRTVDQSVARFLTRNKIADFVSERDGVRARTEDLRAELNSLRGSMREAEAALASTEDRLRQTPETIDLYVDDRASQRVAQAELERKQLLAKYLPTSDPVRAKEREIMELRELINANGGAATGGRRVGPNTVHQALMTERNKFQALADSYREKEYVLQQQLNSADGKVAKLTSLSPAYENLQREKRTLETQLSALNAREQTALIEQQQAQANSENVKLINGASLPRKGRNMKKIVQFLSIIGAAFTALMVGLLGVFLDPSIYGAPRPLHGARPSSDLDNADVSNYGMGQTHPQVPEPVQPYMPQEAPAYAPAAYGATAYGNDYGQPAAQAYADPYAAPYAEGYVDANTQYAAYDQMQPQYMAATGTGGYADYSPQAYGAAGTTEMPNPYASAHAQVIAGPNGEQVPIIGQTTPAG